MVTLTFTGGREVSMKGNNIRSNERKFLSRNSWTDQCYTLLAVLWHPTSVLPPSQRLLRPQVHTELHSPPADTSDANSDDDSDDSGAATDRDVRAIRPATAGCCTPAVAAFPHAHFTFIHPNPPTEASHSRIHPPSVCPRSPETSTACPRVPRTSLQGAPPLFVYRSNGHSITRIQYHCPSGSQGLQ